MARLQDKSESFDLRQAPIKQSAAFFRMKTRQERADARKVNIFSHYDAKLQAFLDFVLSQYVKEGVGELDQAKLPHLLELRYRAISDAAAELGGVARIRDAFVGFQAHLYAR